MDFKAGQKVRVKKNLKEIQNFKGGYISDMAAFEGKIVTIITTYPGGRVYIEGSCLCWDKRAFEPLKYTISKDELLKMPIGSKITVGATKYTTLIKVENDKWRNEDGYLVYDDDISKDLEIESHPAYKNNTKILKVEEPNYTTVYLREDNIKEMTVAEIEKQLGYQIKIAKEDK